MATHKASMPTRQAPIHYLHEPTYTTAGRAKAKRAKRVKLSLQSIKLAWRLVKAKIEKAFKIKSTAAATAVHKADQERMSYESWITESFHSESFHSDRNSTSSF